MDMDMISHLPISSKAKGKIIFYCRRSTLVFIGLFVFGCIVNAMHASLLFIRGDYRVAKWILASSILLVVVVFQFFEMRYVIREFTRALRDSK